MEYSKITYYAALFANDLHHILIHAAGPNMEDIRATASQLHYRARSDMEDLSKIAIINNEKVDNINAIRSHVPDTEWRAIDVDAVDFETFVYYLRDNGQQYLNALKNFDGDKNFEDKISFWTNEILYENGQRLAALKPKEEIPETPVELVNTPQNPTQDAVIIAIPDWRSVGASSALSQSVLGYNS